MSTYFCTFYFFFTLTTYFYSDIIFFRIGGEKIE
nr:MAG TPA: hypothetical protein [Caudoviricetes sp.]